MKKLHNLPLMIRYLFPLLLVGCGMDAENNIVTEKDIPGTRYKAVLFTRDAGATNSESYQMSIIPIGSSLPQEAGNIYICDKVSGINFSCSSNTVIIEINKSARNFKQEKIYMGINILYKDSSIIIGK